MPVTPLKKSSRKSRNASSTLHFFVDDNISANMEHARALLHALIPLKIRWVGQCSINAACDEEFVQLLAASGCYGILIGFESLNPNNLKMMNKGTNLIEGVYATGLANLRNISCVSTPLLFLATTKTMRPVSRLLSNSLWIKNFTWRLLIT